MMNPGDASKNGQGNGRLDIRAIAWITRLIVCLSRRANHSGTHHSLPTKGPLAAPNTTASLTVSNRPSFESSASRRQLIKANRPPVAAGRSFLEQHLTAAR